MSKNKLVFAAVVALLALLAGTLVIVEYLGPPRTFVLKVDGTVGQEVVGTIEENGVKRHVKQTLPATIELKATRLVFDLVPGEDDGSQLAVDVTVDGVWLMKVSGVLGAHGKGFQPRLFRQIRGDLGISGMSRQEAADIRNELRKGP